MNILVINNNLITLHQHELDLSKWGHIVYTADNRLRIYSILESTPIDIIICDWFMSAIDGFDLYKTIRSKDPQQYIYFIITGSKNNHKEIFHALKTGADDYIFKPVCNDELRARIEIGSRIVNLKKEAVHQKKYIEKNQQQTVFTFASMLEVFDKNLGRHCRRVSKLALRLAKKNSAIPAEEYQLIEMAALLHDIGMIGLPNKIFLKKRTELTGNEKELYLSHPERGEIILNKVESLHPAARIIRTHHEQYNGKGFPDGIMGDELSMHAQIVSAASIYDNIVNKAKFDFKDIPGKLHRLSGYQLSPEIVNDLFKINIENIYEESIKNYLEIRIDDLKNGMTLARDVIMKTGAIIMPTGTKLTSYSIEKLQTYRALKNFDQNIFILKNSHEDL